MANLLHIKGSRNQIRTSFPTSSIGNDGDIIFASIKGQGTYLCSKINGRWFASNKLQNLERLEKTSIKDLLTKKLHINSTLLTTNKYNVSTGDFTLDVAGDIELNADGGQVTIKDDTASHFLFDCDNTRFRIYDDTNANDFFSIAVGTSGATTISTVDAGAEVGHLTLAPDGNLLLSPGTNSATFLDASSGSHTGFTFDKNYTATTGGNAGATFIDYDITGVMGDGQSINARALSISVRSDAPTHHANSEINNYGMELAITGGTSGTQINYGINSIVTGADTNIGFQSKVDDGGVDIKLLSSADTGDYCSIATTTHGDTTITTVDDNATNANLHFTIDGNVDFDVAGTKVEFDGCAVGFDLETPAYDVNDTDVDFQTGNKQFVTFGSGNITDLNLIFPKTSGNFVLLLKQDGTGSRLVTNYKVWDREEGSAASGSATVKFAGGSNPTLTTDANHVDIISFFYDSDNEIAYGVASLDFQF